MSKILILSVLLTAGDCNPHKQGPDETPIEEIGLRVIHDKPRGVTCWLTVREAISCLPDRSLLDATP